EALQAVHMSEYRHTEPHRLSGGQKQRVAIAGVMAVSRKVLILDEATVMLDPKGRAEIMETITNLQQTEQLTLTTITHDLNEVTKVDRVIVLNKGTIWGIDTPRNILEHGNTLREIGLDVPFMTKLAIALREDSIILE